MKLPCCSTGPISLVLKCWSFERRGGGLKTFFVLISIISYFAGLQSFQLWNGENSIWTSVVSPVKWGEQHLPVKLCWQGFSSSKWRAGTIWLFFFLCQPFPIPEKSTVTVHIHTQTDCLKKYRFGHWALLAPNPGSNAYGFCHSDLCSQVLIEGKCVSLRP